VIVADFEQARIYVRIIEANKIHYVDCLLADSQRR